MWPNLFSRLLCRVIFPLALLGLTGGIGAEPFPLCMYGVDNPTDIKTIKKAGFNCFQTYKQDPELLAKLAREAKKQGMQVVFYPNKVIGSSYEEEARKWPILAWYLVDEPDVAKWPRARVLEAYNRAKAAFPTHEMTLVIGQGNTRVSFYDLPDILMVDWYPVPHLPLTSFGEQLALARRGMEKYNAGKNPLWGVVQAFDWKEYKQYRPDNDRVGRFPTTEEIRFMSYHGIVNGVNGLFYFIFTTEGKPLPAAQPEWWARVSAVVRELKKFKPVLEKGQVIDNPVQFTEPLVARSWKYKNKQYTVLLNTSDKPVLLPEKLADKKYKLLFSYQKTPLIPPYQVWVLKH